VDVGCAVGRLSFELVRHADLVIGLDLSAGFVRAARTLVREGQLAYVPVIEGELTEERLVRLPTDLPRERVEFVQGDALALPFPASLFATATSLNLLDRVPVPRHHLAELNRVTKTVGAALLVADPWSWAESPALPTAWLDGRLGGDNAGDSRTNLQHWLVTACRHPGASAARDASTGRCAIAATTSN
jgi:ubiquinone/menaquinone biosynthesis C-methylase UbiE